MEDDFFDDDFIVKEQSKSLKKGCLTTGIALIITFLVIGGGILFYILKLLGAIFQPSEVLIINSISPYGTYEINAYLINGGATTDFAVRADLIVEGEEEKIIYNDYHQKDANIEWIDEDTVKINGHEIELPNGKYQWSPD